MKYKALTALLVLVALACAKAEKAPPIPEGHPAHDFHAIASKGPATEET